MTRVNQSKHQQSSSQLSFENLLFPDVYATSTDSLNPPRLLREEVAAAALGLPEYLPVFTVKLARSEYIRLSERPQILSSSDAASIARKHLDHCDREQIVTLLLDAKCRLIGMNIVSVGDLNTSIVHPREVFKAAILANASSLILAHNHPSGDPTPSPEDVSVSRRIYEAGRILGIDVMDHLVIGDCGRFTSLKERGLM